MSNRRFFGQNLELLKQEQLAPVDTTLLPGEQMDLLADPSDVHMEKYQFKPYPYYIIIKENGSCDVKDGPAIWHHTLNDEPMDLEAAQIFIRERFNSGVDNDG